MSLEARVTVLEDKFDKELEERKLLLEATHGVVCEILKEQHNDRVENARRFDKMERVQAEHSQILAEHTRRFDKIEDTLAIIVDRLSPR